MAALVGQRPLPETAAEVADAGAYRSLLDALSRAAFDTHVMTARCARSIGDVDKSRPGLFLFNYFYFVAEDPEGGGAPGGLVRGEDRPGQRDLGPGHLVQDGAQVPSPMMSTRSVHSLRCPEVSGHGPKQGSRHVAQVNGAWRFSTGRAPMASRREHGRQFAAD
ncbi:hypothetical protein [Actinacidiphila oryziradicis]|uniref:hypothetical protein n=1 Tax=Actinacidiphila oryziradicis TaxID=2571141 RepID=UPI00145D6BF8|nr:hypothetical protein [Actinacidiphila oryziradicis]